MYVHIEARSQEFDKSGILQLTRDSDLKLSSLNMW